MNGNEGAVVLLGALGFCNLLVNIVIMTVAFRIRERLK